MLVRRSARIRSSDWAQCPDLVVHQFYLSSSFVEPSCQVVEFDIERDHHRKGAKNRLVARRIAWDFLSM